MKSSTITLITFLITLLISLIGATDASAQAAQAFAGTELCALARPATMSTGGHALLYYRGGRNSLFRALVLDTGPRDKGFVIPFYAEENAKKRLIGALRSKGNFVVCYQLNKSEESRFSQLLGNRKKLAKWMNEELAAWNLMQNNCTDFVEKVFYTVTGVHLKARLSLGNIATPSALARNIINQNHDFQSDGRGVTLLTNKEIAEHLLK